MPKTPPARTAAQSRLLRDFGRRLRALREERGLTQMALAHEAGIHASYVGSVEAGERNVALINLYALAQAVGVEVEELLPPVPRGKVASPPL